jgi:hypothetical protein
MGQRFRPKASFDISHFSPEVQVILQALKKYGMILADNGSAWFLSGVPDPQWDDDILVSELRLVKGSDFEAVDETSLMVDPDSGQANSTGSAVDTLPPSTPTNLTAIAVSSSQIDLSWSPSSDNLGVAGYRVYRNGTQIGTTANTSYQNGGLSPSKTYRYSVSAYDAAGNISAMSTSASLKTQPLPSERFAIGDRVRGTRKGTIFSTPSPSGTVLGTQLRGALGTVIGGPWYVNRRWWWQVDFDTGSDGWLGQNTFRKVIP